MVLPVSEESVDIKVPVPVLFVVFVDNATVGPLDVPQTTPRVDTDAPPSEVTFPPLLAPVVVILLIAVVVTVGIHNTVMVPVALTLPHPPVN